jgi:nicotinamidase-related amidase
MRRYLALPQRLRRLSAARHLASSLRGTRRREHVGVPTREPAAIRAATPSDSVELFPKECALLVLGCESGILDEVADAESLLLKLNAAVDIVRLHGGHIGFVRIAFEDRDYRFSPTTNKEFSVLTQQRRFRNGTPEAAIHQALAVQSDDIVVRTTRLGAFSTKGLDEQLTNLGVTTLIIAGAHTSGALLSTVREAADRDYRLIVLSDCCVDRDTETHRLLMERVFPRQADIVTAASLYMSLAAEKLDKQRYSETGLASRVL